MKSFEIGAKKEFEMSKSTTVVYLEEWRAAAWIAEAERLWTGKKVPIGVIVDANRILHSKAKGKAKELLHNAPLPHHQDL